MDRPAARLDGGMCLFVAARPAPLPGEKLCRSHGAAETQQRIKGLGISSFSQKGSCLSCFAFCGRPGRENAHAAGRKVPGQMKRKTDPGRGGGQKTIKRPSLKKQLMAMFLCIIVPVGAVLALLLFYAADYSRSRLAHTMASNLQMFTSTLEKQMLSAEAYILNLSLNDATFRNLSEENDQVQAYLDIYEISQGFPALMAANDTLMGVVLVDSSCNLFYGRYGTVYGDPGQQREEKMALVRDLTRMGLYNSINTTQWYLEEIGGRLYLLRSVVSQKSILTTAIDLRMVFEDLLRDYGLDGQVIVYGENGLLVGDAEEGMMDKIRWRNQDYGMMKSEDGLKLVVKYSVDAMDIYYLTPYNRSGVAMSNYEILLTLASFFVLMTVPFLMFYMRQEIFRPMGALVNTMNRISMGDLSARPDMDYRNAEFTQVHETFNRMIDQITQLKIDRYEKEIEARRNEMTALKLQIRPHFVLNCLKSVYGMVQTGSRDDAQQLILLLSRYLRYILSFTTNTIALKSEIEQCYNYVDLCNIGQTDQVRLVCSVDKALEDLPIPQVSLLTLVENSIKHGKVIGQPLQIAITARKLQAGEHQVANLTVSDNGSGFSEEDIRQLNQELPREKEGSHVGLHNVIRRLQLLYGEKSAFAFTNKQAGARVELFLPLDDALHKKGEARP